MIHFHLFLLYLALFNDFYCWWGYMASERSLYNFRYLKPYNLSQCNWFSVRDLNTEPLKYRGGVLSSWRRSLVDAYFHIASVNLHSVCLIICIFWYPSDSYNKCGSWELKNNASLSSVQRRECGQQHALQPAELLASLNNSLET